MPALRQTSSGLCGSVLVGDGGYACSASDLLRFMWQCPGWGWWVCLFCVRPPQGSVAVSWLVVVCMPALRQTSSGLCGSVLVGDGGYACSASDLLRFMWQCPGWGWWVCLLCVRPPQVYVAVSWLGMVGMPALRQTSSGLCGSVLVGSVLVGDGGYACSASDLLRFMWQCPGWGWWVCLLCARPSVLVGDGGYACSASDLFRFMWQCPFHLVSCMSCRLTFYLRVTYPNRAQSIRLFLGVLQNYSLKHVMDVTFWRDNNLFVSLYLRPISDGRCEHSHCLLLCPIVPNQKTRAGMVHVHITRIHTQMPEREYAYFTLK